MEPVIVDGTLGKGNSCYMTINRTMDGSYGTMSINSQDPYLLVFDEFEPEYQNQDRLGLIEEDSYMGWKPRTVMLANIGTKTTNFQVTFDHASAVSMIAATLALFLTTLQ